MGNLGYGIGLDLSTKSTGVAFWQDTNLTGGTLLQANGWLPMRKLILAELDLRTPDWLAVEDTYMAKNVKTKQQLDSLRAIVLGWADDHHVPCYIGTTSQIDSACGFPGGLKRVDRKRTIRAFVKTLGFVFPQDTCDAVAVVFWGQGERRKDLWLATSEQD